MACLHGLVRVRHRPLRPARRGQRRRLQRGVPGQGRPLQQPADERRRPPLVVRAALRAEQRPGEPVGLLGPHAGDRAATARDPRAGLRGLLAERRGDLRRQRLGRAALGQHGRTASTVSGAAAAARAGSGPRPRRLGRAGAGRLARRVAAGRSKKAVPGFSPLSTARTAASRSAAVPLSLAPASMGAAFSAFRRSIRSRTPAARPARPRPRTARRPSRRLSAGQRPSVRPRAAAASAARRRRVRASWTSAASAAPGSLVGVRGLGRRVRLRAHSVLQS